MKKLLLLVPVLIIVGCGLFGGEDYYPLKVGNLWKYEGYTTMQDTTTTTIDTTAMTKYESEITGTAQIGGKDVFVTVLKTTRYSYWPMVDTTVTYDTSYTKEEKDTIWSYETLADTMPTISMVLPLELNKTWMQVSGTDTVTYTVKAKEDMTVPAKAYSNCWKVEMKMSGSDEKAYYWYADGVGLIKYWMDYYTGNYLMKMWLELTASTIN